MEICVLSVQETACYEVYGDYPNCANHHHITFYAALDGVNQDVYRSVSRRNVATGEEEHLDAVTAQSSNEYVWRGRMSGGAKVRQMVRELPARLTDAEQHKIDNIISSAGRTV